MFTKTKTLLIGTNRLLIIMHTNRPAKSKSFIAENNLLQNVMMQLRIFSLRLEKIIMGDTHKFAKNE